jgi:nucleotide-binding universal stress UspA family protein
MSFHKILCPVDFSEGSRQALRIAVRLATQHDAELVLLHTWYVPPVAFAGDYAYPAAVLQQMVDDAQRELDASLDTARALGAKQARALFATGSPGLQICEAAKAGIDLIVIGSHGRSGVARFLLGSVATQVVRHAPCSVLTVRPDGELRPFTHALVPVDFSDSARRAAQVACENVAAGGDVMLLHVQELPIVYAEDPMLADLYHDVERSSTRVLDRWVDEIAASAKLPVKGRTRTGRPAAEVVKVLDDDRSFDLVVMGSHGRTGIARLLLGSVAEKVLHHARCAVLIVREPR